jgi:hypothetical protein
MALMTLHVDVANEDPELHRRAEIYRANPRFAAAGWTFAQFAADPNRAILELFVTPHLADPSPEPARPLPRQILVAWDLAHNDIPEGAYRNGRARARHPDDRPKPTGRRPVRIADGALVEPLAHLTERRPRHRPWKRILARMIASRGWWRSL